MNPAASSANKKSSGNRSRKKKKHKTLKHGWNRCNHLWKKIIHLPLCLGILLRSLDLFPPHVLSQARRIFDDFARHLRKFGTRARHGETKVSANLVFELKGEPKLLQNWASEPVSWVEVQNNRNFSMAHKATLLISYKKGCVESENHHFEKEHLQKLCGLFPVTLLLGCWVWEQRISVILLDLEKLEEKLTCYSCCMARKWTFLHILECCLLRCVFSYGFMSWFHLSMKIMRVGFLGKSPAEPLAFCPRNPGKPAGKKPIQWSKLAHIAALDNLRWTFSELMIQWG